MVKMMKFSKYPSSWNGIKAAGYDVVTIELAVTNTFVVIRAIHWVIPFHWNLLCSAFVLASSAFIVRARWSHWSYHQPSWILFHPSFCTTLWHVKKGIRNAIQFTNSRKLPSLNSSYLVVQSTLIRPLRMRNYSLNSWPCGQWKWKVKAKYLNEKKES